MDDRTQTALGRRLESEASGIALGEAPLDELLSQGRRALRIRRLQSAVAGAGVLALVLVIGAVITGQFDGDRAPIASDSSSEPDLAGQPGPSSAVAAPSPSVPSSSEDSSAGGTTTECLEAYSADAVRQRSFSFDGTVSAIEQPAADRRSDGPSLVRVTFSVREWFQGGSGDSATVSMAPPSGEGSGSSTSEALTFDVGTRLLVSGEPRSGGAALEDLLAWECGFTRPYDEATAADWRQ